MRIIVLAKHVPDPQGTPRLGADHLLVREGVEGVLDPGDEYPLEAGLRLVEREGGEVVVVSMGPEGAMTAIRRALSMGAHRGVLVTDPRLRGADALVTARVLAAAVRRVGFDLVLAGVESTDGSTGTVPIAVAGLLGIPAATFARRLELEGGLLRIERPTEAGYDVVECPLPALATVTAGATEPRYPTLKGIMQAKQKPVEQLTAADLGLGDEELAPTQAVAAVEDAPEKGPGEVVSAEEGIPRIVALLEEARVI